MRINHTGEVCAQALYKGQATTAKLDDVREAMDEAVDEEIDHLAWCEQRINELGGRTSVLNPLFYAASFGIGAAAGVVVTAIRPGNSCNTRSNSARPPDSTDSVSWYG